MNRFILTVAFTITALVLSAGESSAFFRKKRACKPAQTYSAPVVSYTDSSCCGSGMNHHSGNMGYSMPYQSNMGYSTPYYNNMDYGNSNYSYPANNGVVGNVLNETGNIITMPFRMLR